MSRESYNYKRAAIKAAKELYYSTETIGLLQKASTETEIARILATERAK
jgi:hypothetical protein